MDQTDKNKTFAQKFWSSGKTEKLGETFFGKWNYDKNVSLPVGSGIIYVTRV